MKRHDADRRYYELQPTPQLREMRVRLARINAAGTRNARQCAQRVKIIDDILSRRDKEHHS